MNYSTRTRTLNCRSSGVIAAILLGGFFLSGCSSFSAGSGFEAGEGGIGTSTTVIADWDDLDASLDVSLDRGEVAILNRTASADQNDDGRSESGEGRWVLYELVGVRGEPGELRATDAGEADDARLIRLDVTIGKAGDPKRERRLLRAFANRLSRLKGVDVRPLD